MNIDPQTKFLAQMLIYVAEQMECLALARCHVVPYGPHDSRLADWMSKTRPGDLVVERSALSLAPQRVGRMLGVEKVKHEGHSTTVYTIVGIDGEVMRWENCNFMRIPDPNYYRGGGDMPRWRDREKGEGQ